MTDITFSLQAKSDQLNAVDLIGGALQIRITDVAVNRRDQQQPVAVLYEDDDGRPWKPCKGMRRVLSAIYGPDSSRWVGKRVELRYEPSVTYGGQETGGIQISASDGVPPAGAVFKVRKSRTAYFELRVAHLAPAIYPEDLFDERLPAMRDAIATGKMTADDVIARCEKTGTLSKEQIGLLKKVENENGEDNESE